MLKLPLVIIALVFASMLLAAGESSDADVIGKIIDLSPQGVVAGALIWFGRRFLTQNDKLVALVSDALDELKRSRESFDRAREYIERRSNESGKFPPQG